jgi:hypothetical protein
VRHLAPRPPRASRRKSRDPGLGQTSTKNTGQCPLKDGRPRIVRLQRYPTITAYLKVSSARLRSAEASPASLRSALKGYRRYGPVAPPYLAPPRPLLAPLKNGLRSYSPEAQPTGWKASGVADCPEFSINPLYHTICAARTPFTLGALPKTQNLVPVPNIIRPTSQNPGF